MNYDTYRGVFNIDILDGNIPSGEMELPKIFRTDQIPNRLISFDKAIRSNDVDQWVHFFIHDYQFMRIIRNPLRYLPILQKFNGVISPDFSVFWNYPLYLQLQSIARSREIGAWLQRNGVSVVPCTRWGKEETYPFAFDGIEGGGVIAVGTAGCMRETESREVFEKGFRVMIDTLKPKVIVVYGSRRSIVFHEAELKGIEIKSFQTNTSIEFERRSSKWD
jgi:hypothetical protein